MNNTFSLNRFILLFKKYTLEHIKANLLSTAVLAGIAAALMGFAAYTNGGRLPLQVQSIIFIYLIAGAGGIFTSLTFTELGNKRKATGVLTLPASHFEKFMVSWIYSYIIFQLVLIAVFYVVDWAIISVSVPPVHEPNSMVNIFDTDQNALAGFWVFAIFHAFAIWGAIFFEKMHFIKTAFVFFIYLIALIIINDPLLRLITGIKDLHGKPYMQAFYIEGKNYWYINPTDSMINTNLVILGIVVVLFWVSAFFRLKEKEI